VDDLEIWCFNNIAPAQNANKKRGAFYDATKQGAGRLLAKLSASDKQTASTIFKACFGNSLRSSANFYTPRAMANFVRTYRARGLPVGVLHEVDDFTDTDLHCLDGISPFASFAENFQVGPTQFRRQSAEKKVDSQFSNCHCKTKVLVHNKLVYGTIVQVIGYIPYPDIDSDVTHYLLLVQTHKNVQTADGWPQCLPYVELGSGERMWLNIDQIEMFNVEFWPALNEAENVYRANVYNVIEFPLNSFLTKHEAESE
jgi:hypothetical protein